MNQLARTFENLVKAYFFSTPPIGLAHRIGVPRISLHMARSTYRSYSKYFQLFYYFPEGTLRSSSNMGYICRAVLFHHYYQHTGRRGQPRSLYYQVFRILQ